MRYPPRLKDITKLQIDVTRMNTRYLSVGIYAMGFTHWIYKPPAGAFFDDCLKPDYFADASGMMRDGDTITISCQDGVGIRAISVHVDDREKMHMDMVPLR